MTREETFHVRQEPDDVPAGPIVRVAGVSVAIAVAAILTAGAVLVATANPLRHAVPRAREPSPVPGPVEQTPVRDVQRGVDLFDAQRHALERWGWADRQAGVATIPIEEAMQLVVETPP
jgi:hypothetical protein